MAPGKYTPFMAEMDSLRKKLHDTPDVDPRTFPRTRLPFLQSIVEAAPMETGGAAYVSTSPRVSPTQRSTVVLAGATLVRTAMAVHRDRYREKLASTQNRHKNAEAADDGAATTVLYHDSNCVVVADKFPKSAFHFLVMPRDCRRLTSLNDLRSSDVPLLQHMLHIGSSITRAVQDSSCDASEITCNEWVDVHTQIFTPKQESAKEKAMSVKRVADINKDSVFKRDVTLHKELDPSLLVLPRTRVKFLTGFHSLPSLPPLHMHVISLDLLGQCLKNKKHYNSFTSNFFMSSDAIAAELSEYGSIRSNQRYHEFEFLERKQPECVWCGLVCEQMTKLRLHLPVCPKNKAWL